jgi:hypothetical protein
MSKNGLGIYCIIVVAIGSQLTFLNLLRNFHLVRTLPIDPKIVY